MQELTLAFELDGFVVDRYEEGISLYYDKQVSHFPNMIPNGSNSLIAVIAAMLKVSMSIPVAVTMASQRFQGATKIRQDHMSIQEEISS
jgi:bifunctional ADP-heptose synthase (sugar kinase/adenylyltransferase)